jgi:hypothetical protein
LKPALPSEPLHNLAVILATIYGRSSSGAGAGTATRTAVLQVLHKRLTTIEHALGEHDGAHSPGASSAFATPAPFGNPGGFHPHRLQTDFHPAGDFPAALAGCQANCYVIVTCLKLLNTVFCIGSDGGGGGRAAGAAGGADGRQTAPTPTGLESAWTDNGLEGALLRVVNVCQGLAEIPAYMNHPAAQQNMFGGGGGGGGIGGVAEEQPHLCAIATALRLLMASSCRGDVDVGEQLRLQPRRRLVQAEQLLAFSTGVLLDEAGAGPAAPAAAAAGGEGRAATEPAGLSPASPAATLGQDILRRICETAFSLPATETLLRAEAETDDRRRWGRAGDGAAAQRSAEDAERARRTAALAAGIDTAPVAAVVAWVRGLGLHRGGGGGGGGGGGDLGRRGNNGGGGGQGVAAKFEENAVDGPALAELTDADLKEMAVVIGNRKTILRARDALFRP